MESGVSQATSLKGVVSQHLPGEMRPGGYYRVHYYLVLRLSIMGFIAAWRLYRGSFANLAMDCSELGHLEFGRMPLAIEPLGL